MGCCYYQNLILYHNIYIYTMLDLKSSDTPLGYIIHIDNISILCISQVGSAFHPTGKPVGFSPQIYNTLKSLVIFLSPVSISIEIILSAIYPEPLVLREPSSTIYIPPSATVAVPFSSAIRLIPSSAAIQPAAISIL